MEPYQPVAGSAVGEPLPAGDVHEVGGGGPHAPQRPAVGEGEAFVTQGEPGQRPTPVFLPHQILHGDTHLIEEHFVEVRHARHLHDGTDLDTRAIHGTDEVGDALVLGSLGVGAGQQDPERGPVGHGGPHLLPGDHILVAVPFCPRGQRSEVGTGSGFAEELTPHLFPGE